MKAFHSILFCSIHQTEVNNVDLSYRGRQEGGGAGGGVTVRLRFSCDPQGTVLVQMRFSCYTQAMVLE